MSKEGFSSPFVIFCFWIKSRVNKAWILGSCPQKV